MENMKRIKNLGLMLDCSRNAVMTVPQLKRFMTLLRKMGYNQFYLYLEDTYTIEDEPYFGHFRGRYSPDELREIEDTAESLGMEFIPCMQVLAHLNQLMQWPQYAKIQDHGDCMLIGDDQLYELIEKMFRSLRACLRTKKLHIGMDEAYHMGKGKYRDIHGGYDRKEMFMEHLTRVCSILEKYDFEPMMWGDMFYHFANNMQAFAEDEQFDEDLRENLPKNLTAFFFDYNHHTEDTLEKFSQMMNWYQRLTDGHGGFATGCWKWGSFAPRNELSIVSTGYAVEACVQTGVDTLMATIWGDDGDEPSSYVVLPSIVFTACAAHGITDMDQVKAKFREWIGVDFDDFMLMDELDCTPEYMLGYVVNQSKFHLYNDCFLGKFDSMVASYDAANYAKTAAKLSEATQRAGEYQYVFETMTALASVLALKADIGIRTRAIYKNGDRAALDKLIADYHEMICRTEVFYQALRTQWHIENKPHGFEVQDIRLGGLIMRMKNCCDRLEAYRDGKIDRMEELEDESLPYPTGITSYPTTDIKPEDGVEKVNVYKWGEMVTTNVLHNAYGMG